MNLTSVMGAIIISCGLIGFGYFSAKKMKANEELIEVRGLSEKIIQSDIGDISIKIFSKSVNLEELYKKRISDKNKIMKFLKDQGVTYDEIINSSTDTNELEEEVKTVESGITLVYQS